MLAAERHVHAERRARAFLATADITTVAIDELDSGWWRCQLRAAKHPAADDMPVEVVGRGRTRGYALDLAHNELRWEVMRYYLDEPAGRADLNARRELERYEPGMLGARRVAAAIAYRGGQVNLDRAMNAGLHVKVTSGRPVTVGDVVAYLLSGDPSQQILAV